MNKIKSKKVVFFGKITAGITHEIKNVLAIIQESTGLLEDILAVAKDDTFPHKDKFNKSIKRIFDQIQRGVDITARLNRFAHGPDHSSASVDLNEVSEQMVLLASRFTRLKNVVLESSPSDPPLIIRTDPVSLEMALFEAIEIILVLITSGGKIMLSPRKIQNKYVLSIGYENAIPPDSNLLAAISSSEHWESLQDTMTYLGGSAKALDSAPAILLYLPGSINI